MVRAFIAAMRLSVKPSSAASACAVAAVLATLSACSPGAGRTARFDAFPAPSPLHAVAVNGGDVWAAGEGGVIRWSETSVTVLTALDGLPSNDALSLSIAPDGSTWIGTARGLAHVKGTRLRAFPSAPVVEVAADGKDVWAILGATFVGRSSGCMARRGPIVDGIIPSRPPAGLMRLSGSKLVPADPAPPVGTPIALAVSRGALWVAGTEGAAVRPAGGGAWTRLAVAGPVSALAPDPDGRVWLAGAEGIAAAVASGAVTPMPGGDHFRGAARARALALGADGLWIATDKAFYNFDGTVWRRFAAPATPAGAAVVAVAADRATGRAYGASTTRVYRLGTAGFGVAPPGPSWLGRGAVAAFAPGPGAGSIRAGMRMEPARWGSYAPGSLLDTPVVDVGSAPDTGTDTLPTIGTGEGSLRSHLKGPSAGMPGNRPSVALGGAPLPGDDGPPSESGVREIAAGAAPRAVWPVPHLTGLVLAGEWLIAGSDGGISAVRASDLTPVPIAGAAGLGARALAAAPGGASAWAIVVDARTDAVVGVGEIAAGKGGGLALSLAALDDWPGGMAVSIAVSPTPDGPVWLGTGIGLIRLDRAAAGAAPGAAGYTAVVVSAAAEDLGAGPFHAIAARADGGVWVAGCIGLSLFRAGKWSRIRLPEALGGAADIGVLAAGSGDTVLIGIGDQVVEMSAGGEIRRGPVPSPGGPVSAIALAGDGALWIGSVNGAVARVP